MKWRARSVGGVRAPGAQTRRDLAPGVQMRWGRAPGARTRRVQARGARTRWRVARRRLRGAIFGFDLEKRPNLLLSASKVSNEPKTQNFSLKNTSELLLQAFCSAYLCLLYFTGDGSMYLQGKSTDGCTCVCRPFQVPCFLTCMRLIYLCCSLYLPGIQKGLKYLCIVSMLKKSSLPFEQYIRWWDYIEWMMWAVSFKIFYKKSW